MLNKTSLKWRFYLIWWICSIFYTHIYCTENNGLKVVISYLYYVRLLHSYSEKTPKPRLIIIFEGCLCKILVSKCLIKIEFPIDIMIELTFADGWLKIHYDQTDSLEFTPVQSLSQQQSHIRHNPSKSRQRRALAQQIKIK